MNITINLQNRSGYAKVLADQSSGQRPLYLGPARHGKVSSADLSVEQFLAYFDSIDGYCKRKTDIDGNAALVLISDKGIFEISAEDLLQGIAGGNLGEAEKVKAEKYITQRADAARLLAEWQAEQKAMRMGSALRASV